MSEETKLPQGEGTEEPKELSEAELEQASGGIIAVLIGAKDKVAPGGATAKSLVENQDIAGTLKF